MAKYCSVTEVKCYRNYGIRLDYFNGCYKWPEVNLPRRIMTLFKK